MIFHCCFRLNPNCMSLFFLNSQPFVLVRNLFLRLNPNPCPGKGFQWDFDSHSIIWLFDVIVMALQCENHKCKATPITSISLMMSKRNLSKQNFNLFQGQKQPKMRDSMWIENKNICMRMIFSSVYSLIHL